MKTPGDNFLEILCEDIGIKKIENKDMVLTMKEIGVDSLNILEIIMALEEDLNIEITDDEAAVIFGAGRSNTVFQAKNEIDALFVRKTRATS